MSIHMGGKAVSFLFERVLTRLLHHEYRYFLRQFLDGYGFVLLPPQSVKHGNSFVKLR